MKLNKVQNIPVIVLKSVTTTQNSPKYYPVDISGTYFIIARSIKAKSYLLLKNLMQM